MVTTIFEISKIFGDWPETLRAVPRRWDGHGAAGMDVVPPGWMWCRRDGRGAAGMDMASSWRPCGRPETLRAVQNRGEVGRDVERSAETWRGRQRRGEVGTDMERTTGPSGNRQGCRDVSREAQLRDRVRYDHLFLYTSSGWCGIAAGRVGSPQAAWDCQRCDYVKRTFKVRYRNLYRRVL